LGSGAPAGLAAADSEIGDASEPTALVLINSVAARLWCRIAGHVWRRLPTLQRFFGFDSKRNVMVFVNARCARCGAYPRWPQDQGKPFAEDRG